jgi:hypothetical protein
MHLTSDSLLVMLVIGGVAGWLAGLVIRGSGYGINCWARSSAATWSKP